MIKSTTHYFNTEDAVRFGIREAIILTNIRHWLDKNKANGTNVFDGRYWTYNSHSAFMELFPYMTYKQIRTSLQRLTKAGVLMTGNYNKKSYDRTIWYSINDPAYEADPNQILDPSVSPTGLIHLPKRADPSAHTGTPIPYINTDSNTNNKPILLSDKDLLDKTVSYWNKHHGTEIRRTKNKERQLKARLKTFTHDEILAAIYNRSQSAWIKGEGSSHASNWDSLFRNDDQIDKYLGMKPKTHSTQTDNDKNLPKLYPSFEMFYVGDKT